MLCDGVSGLYKPRPGPAGLAPSKGVKLGTKRHINDHRRIKEIADVRDMKRPGVPLCIPDDREGSALRHTGHLRCRDDTDP